MNKSRLKILSTTAVLGAAMTGAASAATYFQDFTFADGTTDLGDGTTIASEVAGTIGTVNSVQGNALRITADGTNNQRASFRIPALPNSSLGWTATFDLTLATNPGGNAHPADGFSFAYGAIPAYAGGTGAGPDAHGAAEGGFGSGNEISFQVDTWDNRNVGGAGNNPGLDIRVNGGILGGTRIDGQILGSDTSLVTGTVSITYDPTTAGYVTTGLDTNANLAGINHGYTGDDSYSWVFSARTGGANEDLIIDNLRITTVPEPTGPALLGLALGSLLLRRRR